ncbi:MAG TPA: YcjF family protein [Kiritimatiellia bacterium]|nr:YcjF family protein [Kiritimatiellia bacterium]HRZ13117.1 YcjF family protein [Kiritimatiellia bacterium]HSA17538.1 YcjF family protein [Kiritimatiellia bacterium]
MISTVLKLMVRLAVILAAILVALFAGELLRFYILLYRIRPLFADIYSWIVVLILVSVLVYILYLLRRHPPIPQPPRVTGREPDHVRMRKYCRYLVDYLNHMARNPNLGADRQSVLRQGAGEIREVLGAHPLNEDLARLILKTEEQVVLPALAELNALASAEVRHSVRDVMMGVTLSPYQALDLIMVSYRNLAMAGRIVRLYHGRPAPGDSWRILRDVLVTVATVNALGLTRKLFASLLSEVPLVGRVVEGIGQGLGAGLMTSITGHAAMDRCMSFRGWNAEEERRSLGERMAGFLADVRDLFTKDLLPQLKGLIRSGAQPGAADQPGFWDSIAHGIGSAVDLTARMADTLVVQPVVAVGAGVVQAGTYLTRGAVQAGQTAVRVTRRRVRHASTGAGRVLRTFGQRLYYLFRGPR